MIVDSNFDSFDAIYCRSVGLLKEEIENHQTDLKYSKENEARLKGFLKDHEE